MWEDGRSLLVHYPGHPDYIGNTYIQIHIKCVCLIGSDLLGFGAAPDLRPVLRCAIGSCYRHGELRAVGHFWGENVSRLLMKFKKPETTETAECFQQSWDPPTPTPTAGDPIQSKGATNATASLGHVATARN